MKETFFQILVRSDKKIEEARAHRITSALYDEQVALVAAKRSTLRRIEHEISGMFDLSAGNQTTVVNRVMDLDGKDFCQRLQDLKISKDLAEVEYKIAVETLHELFSDVLQEETTNKGTLEAE